MTQGFNKQLPMIRPSGTVANVNKFSPIRGLGGALGAGLMLLPAWFGKDKYGAVGPGRATLNMMYGKPSQEDMARYKQSYDDTVKLLNDIFGGKKQEAKEATPINNSKLSDVPTFDIIDDNALGDVNKIQSDRASEIGQRLGVQDRIVPSTNVVLNNDTATTAPRPVGDTKAILDYISELQKINQPYVDALQNYYNNYNRNLRNYHKARDFYTGLAGWSGNNLWADVGKDYNTVANEANKLQALKQSQDIQAANLNAINEAMGNMAIAEELGLSPETAFANKNLLTALSMKDRDETKKAIALENALVKYYGIDRNNARAIAVQNLRNQGNLATALAYMGQGGMMPYGYQPAPGLNYTGTVPTQQPLQNGIDPNKAIRLEQALSQAQQQNR